MPNPDDILNSIRGPSGVNGRDITISLARRRRADIIGFGDNQVYVARNGGNGSNGPLFSEVSVAYTGFGFAGAGWRMEKHLRLIADTTGDGLGDIVGFGDNKIHVARNKGDGTFENSREVSTHFTCSLGWQVDKHPRFVVDLTGDGYADILGFGDDGVSVSRNTGDGTFGPSTLRLKSFGLKPEAGGWDSSKHLRFLADANGDGLPDIYGFGDTGVILSTNSISQDGTFNPQVKISDSFGCNFGWSIEKHPRFVVDLTGDRTGDLIGFGDGGFFVSLNDGSGNFLPVKRVLNMFGYDGGWRVDRHLRLVADVMGYGRGDIVAFGEEGVWLSINNGSGSFSLPSLVLDGFGCSKNAGSWSVDKHPRSLVDLTGDGRADILGFAEDGVYVSLNEGRGKFGPIRKVTTEFSSVNGGWSTEKHLRYLANVFPKT